MDRLYPAAFRADVAALKQARRRDEATDGWVWSSAPPESVETAIRFLEADLDCFRSGYVKERLIRHLVRQDLDDEALRRLRRVVLSALDRPARREFGAICRLAIRVSDDALRAEIASFARNEDPEIAKRGAWMRDAILEGRVGLQARQRPASRRELFRAEPRSTGLQGLFPSTYQALRISMTFFRKTALTPGKPSPYIRPSTAALPLSSGCGSLSRL